MKNEKAARRRPVISAGQKLWFAPYKPREAAREITIISVGLKWATLSGGLGRLEIATMRMEATGYGYVRAGDVYLSEADYLQEMERQKAWRKLRAEINGRDPAATSDVQTHHITEARKLLGF
jgi:hypothetical protein